MEPEVHIIEKYFQEIMHCFTMTNIRCKGGKEIDLLAVNPRKGEKYHVESRIGTSPSFKIREKDTYTSKGTPRKIGLDYFHKEKFEHPMVKDKIKNFFTTAVYKKVLVVWDADLGLVEKAHTDFGLEIWFIDDLLEVLINYGQMKGSRDDVLRIAELFSLVRRDQQLKSKRQERRSKRQLMVVKRTMKRLLDSGELEMEAIFDRMPKRKLEQMLKLFEDRLKRYEEENKHESKA